MSQNKTQWIAFKTLLTREVSRMLRIWTQTFLPSVMTVVLYFAIFGQLIGHQIPSIQGFTYMQFLAPGLIMMMMIQNAYANVSSSFFGQRFQNSIEEILVSPMRPTLILLGFLSGGLLRGLGVGFLISVIALLFTKIHVAHLLTMVLSATLATLLFALAGFTNGLFAKKFDDIAIVPTFIITPLTYFGGVFYSIDMLSPFFKTLSLFNPILYIVSTFRYSLLGISDVPIGLSMGVLLAMVVALFTLNCAFLKKGALRQ